MTDGFRLRLQWRLTHPEKVDDYVCVGAAGASGEIGRVVYDAKAIIVPKWTWVCCAFVPGQETFLCGSGFADSKLHAARFVERYYFAHLGRTPATANRLAS